VIPRILPVLLLDDGGLVKTTRFKDPRYVGDPINAVRIFNDKQADELVLLDIRATSEGRGPDFEAIEDIASEAFMPLAYGGGIRDLATATRLIQLGIEKVVVNALVAEDPDEVRRMASRLGSSTVVAGIDARRVGPGQYDAVTRNATRRSGIDVRQRAEAAVALGAGEIFLNAVDRDGTMDGYDLSLLRLVTSVVGVPVIACGGAGSMTDLASAVVEGGAAAAAAGSFFVFHGRHRAVLITYPPYAERAALFPG
jgi:imidazole glycerol-phosphate synthase subunit HisF